MRRLFATVFLVALGACASKGMDEAECRAADWRAIGYEDGALGQNPGGFGKRRKACAEHGVTAGFQAYLDGHAEGLMLFCRPQNGFRLGTHGQGYGGICPAELEGAFLAAHTDGYGLYERKIALSDLNKRLRRSKRRSQAIDQLVVEKTALLFLPDITAVQRAAIAVELEQLAAEKSEIEQSIPRLERDYAAAERDFNSYRGRIADRHRG